MIKNFTPKMEILPPPQQRLWPELSPAVDLGFVLYGGTAIALQLGHRPSVDFDFFTEKPLNREELFTTFPFMQQSTVLQDLPNTLSVLVPYGDSEHDHVKVSFFGTIDNGRVCEPRLTTDGVMQVASLDDLMATKAKVILQRVEAKDYRDVAAMAKAGVSIAKGLAAARKMYGLSFQPSESLKAMVYFEGGDLHTLSQDEKRILVKAVSTVRDLPDVEIKHGSLALPMLRRDLSGLEEADMIRRIEIIHDLKNSAGAAYTFYRLACEAVKKAANDPYEVDWVKVEEATVRESIGEHEQPPEAVLDVLCKHSPGAVTPERQAALRMFITQFTTEIQSTSQKKPTPSSKNDRGFNPM